MKTKLALLAALTLIGIGSNRALIGRDAYEATPAVTAVQAPAAKSCCAMREKPPAKPADKDAAAPAGTSCDAAKPSAAVAKKVCCK